MTEKEITEQIRVAYNGIAMVYQEAYADADEYDLKYIKDFTEYLCGRRVIDLGCGTGTIVGYLARRGFEVLGIDNSENMLEVAKTNHPEIQFMKMNILDITSGFHKFDGIVLSYVVNHFNHEMLNKLKPIAVTTQAETMGEMILRQYFANNPSKPSIIPPTMTAPITASYPH